MAQSTPDLIQGWKVPWRREVVCSQNRSGDVPVVFPGVRRHPGSVANSSSYSAVGLYVHGSEGMQYIAVSRTFRVMAVRWVYGNEHQQLCAAWS